LEPEVHECECAICQAGEDQAVRAHHRQINLLLSRLDEAQQRWYVGVLSTTENAPSDSLLAQITGLTEKTIQRGRAELENGLRETPPGRVRRSGGGRKKAEKKTPS
jgi:hypothetical protein